MGIVQKEEVVVEKPYFLDAKNDSNPLELAIWAAKTQQYAAAVEFGHLSDERVVVAYLGVNATEEDMRNFIRTWKS
jgi:hypothetical protein